MADPADAHTERRDRFVTVDGAEVHYSEWGDPADDPVVCVHGFSRNGRDFDPLARALSLDHGFRVLCPDVPGRGSSEWSRTPEKDYTEPALAATVSGLCDELGLDALRWVGTSMGGVLGIRAAAERLRGRIERLVLNDIGPGPVDSSGERPGVERIRDYLSDPPEVRTLGELEAHFRDTYGTNRPNADIRRLTVTSARRTDDGYWTPDYDPRIVDVRFDDYEPRDLWDEWDRIDADVLVLRGAESDLLSVETVAEMTDRKPNCDVIEYPGVGHAPSLASDEQIDAVADFLAG